METMYSDELTDLLGILDESQVNKLLAKMREQDARAIKL